MDERLPITDNPRSDRIRALVSLGRRSFRSRRKLLRVEGPQALAELFAWRGGTVKEIFFTESAIRRHSALWQEAGQTTVKRFVLSPQIAKQSFPEAQGIVGVCAASAVNADPSVTWDPTLNPLVVLPQTQDPGNAGNIIRNADAFGARAVIAAKGSVDLSSPKVIRASAGSVFHLPIIQGALFPDLIDDLRGRGWTILGAAGDSDAAELGDIDLRRPHVWIFGNEAQGLTDAELLL